MLAFASHHLGKVNLDGKYLKGDLDSQPLDIELAFVTEDAFPTSSKAIEHGTLPIK